MKPRTVALGCVFALTCLACSDPPVRVFERTEGASVFIHARNTTAAPVTISLELDLENMAVVGGLAPYYVVESNRSARLLEVVVQNPDEASNHAMRWRSKFGNPASRHEDAYPYRLPLAPGSSARIGQGFGGRFSHRGDNRYGIDFDLAEGSPVHAARGGVVVQVEERFSEGGSTQAYLDQANFVSIAHSDGTIGHYAHLRRGGVEVEEGMHVTAGQRIGESGDTGFSNHPHLHFEVNRPVDGRRRETLPIRFSAVEGEGLVLQQGQSYTATAR